MNIPAQPVYFAIKRPTMSSDDRQPVQFTRIDKPDLTPDPNIPTYKIIKPKRKINTMKKIKKKPFKTFPTEKPLTQAQAKRQANKMKRELSQPDYSKPEEMKVLKKRAKEGILSHEQRHALREQEENAKKQKLELENINQIIY